MTNTIKILHLNTYDILGGAARAAYRIHTALRKSGIQSEMLVARKDSCDDSVRAFNIPFWKLKKRFSNKLLALQQTTNPTYHTCNLFSSGIYKMINRSDADLIHFHWIGAELIGIFEIKKISKPIIWTLHDMWAFCGAEHYHELDFPGRYREGYNLMNRPTTHKGRFDIDRWTWRRKKKRWRYIDFHFVTPSTWLADCIKKSALFFGTPAAVIPNCLDLSVFTPKNKNESRRIFNLPQDKYLILFGADGGKRNPLKGFHLLEDALKTLGTSGISDDIECVIFGGKDAGRKMINNILVTDVGHIYNDDLLAALYSSADLFVTASKVDNLPNILMESMSCETPCVGFRTSGIPNLIDHQQTGFLAEPFSTRELAEGIFWVLNDDDRRKRIGEQAQKKVERCYNYPVVASQYVELYQTVLAN